MTSLQTIENATQYFLSQLNMIIDAQLNDITNLYKWLVKLYKNEAMIWQAILSTHLTRKPLRMFINQQVSTHIDPLLQHSTLHRPRGNSQVSNMSSSSSSSSPHTIKQSSRPWNRDVCASLNIMRIVYGKAYDTLPSCFKQPKLKKK